MNRGTGLQKAGEERGKVVFERMAGRGGMGLAWMGGEVPRGKWGEEEGGALMIVGN